MLCLIFIPIWLAGGVAPHARTLAYWALDLATRHVVPATLAVASFAAGTGTAAIHAVPARQAAVQRTVESTVTRVVQHGTNIAAERASAGKAAIVRTAPAAARPILSKAFSRVTTLQSVVSDVLPTVRRIR